MTKNHSILLFFCLWSISLPSFSQRLTLDTVPSAYVELYLPQDMWHGYCLPVETSLTYPFTDLMIDMRWYDEPTHRWWTVTDTTGDSLLADPMRGYHLWSGSLLTGNSTVGVTGKLNTGYKVVNVTATPSPEGVTGLNYIGNPYPSAVNWYMVGLIGVDPTLYVFSPVWNNYVFWNRFINVHSGICRFIIPAMQGFFVHCSVPPPGSGQVVMTNICRIHDNGQIYKANPDYDNFLSMTATGNGYRDESFLWMSDSATLGFDGSYDAVKIMGEAAAPQLYSLIEGGMEAALNTRPWNWPWPKAELGFRTGVSGVDTLLFEGMESFPDTVDIWLEDKKESQYQLLKEDPEYIFTAAPGDDPARFTLWFYNPWTAVRAPETQEFRIWSFEDKIYVDLTNSANPRIHESTKTGILTLTLYDLAGRRAFTADVDAGRLSILEPGLVQGYYAAVLETGGIPVVRKVFIR